MASMKFYSLWMALFCVFTAIMQVFIKGFTETFLLTSGALSMPWQFVTSIFLHGSLLHLMFNLFALVFFGLVIEGIIGSKRFLFLFFASGIFANIISFNFYPASLGASGAILGLIGCLAALKPWMIIWTFNMPMPMFLAAIIWIAASILGVFGLGDSGTGYIAHLSGIMFGIIYGLILRLNVAQKKRSLSYSSKIVIPESYMRGWENYYLKK